MEFLPLKLKGSYEIRLKPIGDPRGYFVMTYQRDPFHKLGLVTDFLQENQSRSSRGVVRGLHFQLPPHTETKLVRVVEGSIWDCFVDLRNDSPTFGQWDALELSAEKHNMAYIPRGFAHGFCVTSDSATVCYKVDHLYAPNSQAGLRWNDPTLNIPWPLHGATPIISPKDQSAPLFQGYQSPF